MYTYFILIYNYILYLRTESNLVVSDEETSEQDRETEDLDSSDNWEKNASQVNIDDKDTDLQTLPKKKGNQTENSQSKFGSSLLKILENRQTMPEDRDKYFLMLLLPQIRTLTEDQKTQLHIEFLSAIQRVKHSTSVHPAYPYHTSPNTSYPYTQPYPSSRHHYTANISRPLSHLSNDIPFQYNSTINSNNLLPTAHTTQQLNCYYKNPPDSD